MHLLLQSLENLSSNNFTQSFHRGNIQKNKTNETQQLLHFNFCALGKFQLKFYSSSKTVSIGLGLCAYVDHQGLILILIGFHPYPSSSHFFSLLRIPKLPHNPS